MNSNLDALEVNALNDVAKLAYEIAKQYEKEKASETIANLILKIANGGSYHDVYEYARKMNVGKMFKNAINQHEYAFNMDNYIELAKEFVIIANNYANDISDMTEIVQKSLYDTMHVHFNPVKVSPDKKTLEDIINLALSENGKIEYIDNEILKFSTDLIDETIQRNAEVQAKSGFDVVLIRTYDDRGIHGKHGKYGDKYLEDCKWCMDRAGVYNYSDVLTGDKEVFRRHTGCSCSIDLVNKGISKRVNNYTKV